MKLKKRLSLGPTLVAGVLVLLPLAATVYVVWSGFRLADGVVGKWVKVIVHKPVPGVGALVTLGLIVLVGLAVTHLAGKRFFDWLERQMGRIPLARSVYLGVRQMVDAVSQPDKGAFRKAVLVEYPRPGAYSVGFLTNKDYRVGQDENAVSVFMPTALNPTSGFFIVVPRDKAKPLDMSIEAAFKLVVSGGILESGVRPNEGR